MSPALTDDRLRIRPADADDAPELARLIDIAGGGIYEFLLDGLMPGMTAAEVAERARATIYAYDAAIGA